MRSGDLVKLKEDAIISLNLDYARDYFGILLSKDIWDYTDEDNKEPNTSIVWKVFIENQIYEVHNFSLDKV